MLGGGSSSLSSFHGVSEWRTALPKSPIQLFGLHGRGSVGHVGTCFSGTDHPALTPNPRRIFLMAPLHICIPSPETASGRRSSLRSGGLDCKGGGRLGERPLFTVYRGISSCCLHALTTTREALCKYANFNGRPVTPHTSHLCVPLKSQPGSL